MNGRFVKLLALLFLMAGSVDAQQPREWPIHSLDRPQPPVVDPGAGALPVPPPKDATVLFDGTDLSKWVHADGKAPSFVVRDGYFEVQRGLVAFNTTPRTKWLTREEYRTCSQESS